MRRRPIGLLIACTLLACRPSDDPACIRPLWRLELDAADRQPCAVRIDDDGTIVLLLRGSAVSLVEVTADGVLEREIALPMPASLPPPSCLDLAIAEDGTRIALTAVRSDEARPRVIAHHVHRSGAIDAKELVGPTGHTWWPVRIAVEGDDIVVVGARQAVASDNAPYEAFLGRVDLPAWRLEDPHVDTAFARVGPITLRDGRVHALLSPSSIDYARRWLLAFDPDGEVWRRQVGVDLWGWSDPVVTAIVPVGREVVAFELRNDGHSVARFDADGHERWRHVEEEPLDALDGVRTADRLVEVATPRATYLEPTEDPPRVSVRTQGGALVCSEPLSADVGRGIWLGANDAADTFVTVARAEQSDEDDGALGIAAWAVQ